ncbi:MAG: hypothetical protein AAFO57_00535 [Pseudomonadota bacterium]
MNLSEWLVATTTANKAPISKEERARRHAERARVLKKADTTLGTLLVSKCRNKIGIKLARRLEKATKGTSAEFKVADQMPELVLKK